MKRFAFLFWRTVCPMKSWRQWPRCTKWRIAQMLRWAFKYVLRISVEHWALGMDVIHSNTNENMRISIKGNVTKRMPKKWICCQSSACLYDKNPLQQVPTNQVEFKWIRLGLAAKWDKAVQPALRLATVQVWSSFCFFEMRLSWSSWSQLPQCRLDLVFFLFPFWKLLSWSPWS